MADIRPNFNFTYEPSASPFTLTLQAYLNAHANAEFQYVGTGALVFDKTETTKPRVLLIQRSGSDSMPNLWEVPGGGCDHEDTSILHAAARELWEETGLEAIHISASIGDPHLFVSRSGKHIGKFDFVVQVKKDTEGRFPQAKLNPEEHQRFLWASEDEVRAGRAGDVRLDLAAKELELTVLLAFRELK